MSNYGYGQNRYDDRAGSQPQYGAGGYGNTQPYDSRPQYDNTPPNQQYGRQPQYNMPNNGRDEYEDGSVELKPLVANGQEYGQSNNPNAILDECKSIQNAIQDLTQNELPRLQGIQRAVINDPDASANSKSSRDLEQQSEEVMLAYRALTERVRMIKSSPEANSPKNKLQVGNTSRALKSAINQFQQIDTQHSKQLKEQMARQYKIVRPDASDAEVREAVDDTSGQQVFSQALMQGNRRGEAQSIMRAVESRHAEIQKIESQMIQLSELFQEMENLVVQQEAAVVNIEMKGEEVVENMDKGTQEIGVAIQSAKNTRKWKWWCLGICVAIVIVIVIIALLYQFVFGPNAKANRDATQSKPAQKRWVLPSADVFALGSKPCSKSKSNIKVPGLEFTDSFELVRRTKHFRA